MPVILIVGSYLGTISHTLSAYENLKTNRTPLLYILHKLFNPFVGSEISYRRSVFIFSLITPVLFYLCLKQKFRETENLILILITSTIFLSPYFRTSAFWGLEENFGIVFSWSVIEKKSQ